RTTAWPSTGTRSARRTVAAAASSFARSTAIRTRTGCVSRCGASSGGRSLVGFVCHDSPSLSVGLTGNFRRQVQSRGTVVLHSQAAPGAWTAYSIQGVKITDRLDPLRVAIYALTGSDSPAGEAGSGAPSGSAAVGGPAAASGAAAPP